MRPTDEQIQNFIKGNLFHCPKLKAKVSPKTCNINQHKYTTLRDKFIFDSRYPFRHCKDCKTGKKHFIEKKEIRNPQQKECLLHTILPEICKSHEKGGIFHEDITDVTHTFRRKKFCSIDCAKIAAYPQHKETIRELKK